MTMVQRMHKSQAELDLIRHGAGVADVGGFAIRDAIDVGAREIDVAMAGRDCDGAGDRQAVPRLRNIATAGFGSSLGSTQTAHITL